MTTTKHHLLIISSICVVGIALLAFAGFGVYDYYHTTHSGESFPSSETVSRDVPVSERTISVDDSEGYTVSANQPRVIEIPSLHVKGYVQRVGVAADGAMATPSNINFAGWYVRNPAPGESGVSIINGHAGGRYTDGIFKHIGQLKAGDTLTLQMGDLSWRNFEVISSKIYPVADAGTALFKDDPSIDQELHLITCDGDFNDASQTYDARAIVVAKFIQE